MRLQWRVESSQLTDIGRRRQQNQDYVGCFEAQKPHRLSAYGQLYLVADGVGGGAAGDKASRHAVQRILHEYYNDPQPDATQRLVSAIESTNLDIFQYNSQFSNNGKMSTTIVAALLHGLELIVASVGDSRAYLVRDGSPEQITRDHSLVAQMVEHGLISPEQARCHPHRNIIMRSLGMREVVDIDCFARSLAEGDVVVLCSDGLTGHVSDREIARLVTAQSAQAATRALVELANARGGYDNIAVSVMRILRESNGHY
jgi:serine/threonine protein phosphatase PrpC